MGKMTKKAELQAMEEMAVHARAATDLLKVDKAGELEMTWTEETGKSWSATRKIAVS